MRLTRLCVLRAEVDTKSIGALFRAGGKVQELFDPSHTEHVKSPVSQQARLTVKVGSWLQLQWHLLATRVLSHSL